MVRLLEKFLKKKSTRDYHELSSLIGVPRFCYNSVIHKIESPRKIFGSEKAFLLGKHPIIQHILE